VAESIIQYAQKDDFDLVVLSSHGQDGLSDVPQTVIYRTGKSILLVRADQACEMQEIGDGHPFRYHRILVALDGSPRAEAVLPVASVLAQHQGAELILAHVVARPEMMSHLPLTIQDTALLDQLVERNQCRATHYFANLQAQLSPAPQLQIVVNQHVAATLHSLVDQVAADLVILCAHGASGQPQWPYGKVATHFITYGTTPLLIWQDLMPQDMPRRQVEHLANLPPIAAWP
jgi:nucleotide-binding universal stress UspA family protein